MKIEIQDDCRIAVELTKDDMKNLDITYEELDYSNIETRRVLWTVLDKASNTIGYDINLSERMLIEAIPANAGGCIIYFTVLPKQEGGSDKKIIKETQAAVMCQIDEIDDVFAVCEILKNKDFLQKSELYAKDNSYRLVIYSSPEDEDLSISILCEYGDIINKNKDMERLRTKEYWKLLASPDAVSRF